ncbi:O-antigen ligase family protein [Microbacterium radiodurans]|uniref:O-antigen ligase family protein n=1 Tax=Microbacterium radiodurans TaxID=661398 RepID=A0A5J5INT1_9MICO|nr:O-antigen ligase family protein [Microbacterium radiodurans]KAA9085096.1 O-antigen ligase family protein [Microbacterium radiodurans]
MSPPELSRSWFVRTLDSAAFAQAFAQTALAAVFAEHLVERTAGRVTYNAVIAGLCILGAAMLVVRRRELSLVRVAPTTLVLFLGWALASVAWTTDEGGTIAGWLSAGSIAFLAVVIGNTRDTLQTVRALADVFRVLLITSLVLELLSGVFFDMPFAFLGIEGDIASLGPIQGAFGTRNALGFIAVLALITFYIEWRTVSVRPGLSLFSAALAALLAALSDSPTVLVLAVATAAATAVLTLVRRVRRSARATVQLALGSVVLVGAFLGYLLRERIIRWIGAGTDFSIRSELWSQTAAYIRFEPVQGWGWFGAWSRGDFPFIAINRALNDRHGSALNAYVDVVLQLGWVGLLLFIAFAGLALGRAWLVATERRSILYAWTPLILVTLLVDSLFESFTLHGYGWLMLVLCALRAGQSRSWRERIPDSPRLPPVERGGAGDPPTGTHRIAR